MSTYVAAHVELGTASLSGGVERNGLSAEKVVTRGDAGGDLDVLFTAAFVQLVVGPGLGSRVVAGLENLEPGR